MTIFSDKLRYGTVAQTFHWVTVILVAAAWLVAGRDESPTIVLHETLGATIFVLVAARLIWRVFDRRPEEVPMPKVMSLASRALHGLLYLLLFAIPLSAIVGTQLQGHPVVLYGFGEIGPFLTASRHLGHQILEVHQFMGTLIVWLAGLHAAAALWHHYFRKDGVLRAMLPGGRPA
jgi:cytochrome b561